MSLSTNSYGYVVDPLLALTNEKGKTISDGYIRVFFAGTSTPAITYANFEGATNEERIQLDNSGRCATLVIASNAHLYKVCVYDKKHSPDNPLFTLDNVAVTVSSTEFTHSTDVEPGTYTKVKVNAEGLVEEGFSLTEFDIPNLPASKITSGTLDPDRIADESINGDEKLQDGSVGASKIAVDASKGLVDGLNTTVRVDDNDVMVDAHDNTIEALSGETREPDGATDTITIERGKYYYIQSDHNVAVDLETDESETTVHTNLVLVAVDNCVSFDIAFEAVGSYQTAHVNVTVNPGEVVVLYCQIRKIETAPGVYKTPARVWQSNEEY